MDEARVRENITQTEVIHNLMLLAMEYAEDFTDKQRFWRGLVDEITERMLPAVNQERVWRMTDVMSDVEAKAFGRRPIPYGEFAGTRVDEVPLERLCWYADQRWTDELRRYLKSKRIQAEIES